MKYGVLDQSPIHGGRDHARALQSSVELARGCEQAGYHRYWLAEHHGVPALGGPSPELLIPYVAAATRTIRVGSGGVMLPHYSPFKVAENFGLLECMHPGRIDLGIGRAPGGSDAVASALAYPHAPLSREDHYAAMAADLIGFLEDRFAPDHPYARVDLVPRASGVPELWMLGSGSGSAELAGRLGMGFALALFIGSDDKPVEIVDMYRRAFRASPRCPEPRVLIAQFVICAESDEEAAHLFLTRSRMVSTFMTGKLEALRPPEEVAGMAMTPEQEKIFHACQRAGVLGPPATCAEKLHALATRYRADEVMVVSITYDFDARLRSYQLLAGALGIAG